MDASTSTTLERYLQAESKYNFAPVPMHLAKDDISAFVAEQFAAEHPLSNHRVQQLVQLAIHYELTEVADHLTSALQSNLDGESLDVQAATFAIEGLAWLGSENQLQLANDAFDSVTQRANWTSDTNLLLIAAFALNNNDSLECLRTTANRELNKVNDQITKLAESEDQQLVSALENYQAQLTEFASFELPELEEANLIREAIANADPAQAHPALIALYLETTDQATPALATWAAQTLNRLRGKPEQIELAAQLKNIADAQPVDDDPESGPNLTRARAMRAAIFFGWQADEETVLWLAKVGDTGFDLLANRPQWKYPSLDPEQ